MMMIVDVIIGVVVLSLMILFIYIFLHMENEKHYKKGLPMLWEKGGRFAKYFGHDSEKDEIQK